jgi:hypothetical protein
MSTINRNLFIHRSSIFRALCLGLMAAALVIAMTAATTANGLPSLIRADADRPGNGVVLGSKKFAPYGKGFGKVKPRIVFNGGVPSGLVRKVKWSRWGEPVALGHGRGSQYKPDGGYYKKPVGVRFRAQKLGKCRGSRRQAYTQLRFQAQRKPGGKYGAWMYWSGSTSICRLKFP